MAATRAIPSQHEKSVPPAPPDLLMNPFYYYLARSSPQNTVIKIKSCFIKGISLPDATSLRDSELQEIKHLRPESEYNLVFKRSRHITSHLLPCKEDKIIRAQLQNLMVYLHRQGSKSSLPQPGHHCTFTSIIFPDTPCWEVGGKHTCQGCKTT